RDNWPPAAGLLVAAYYGDIRRLKGRPEIAKFLLSKGVRVDVESSVLTPLIIATFRGYLVSMALKHSYVSCLKLLVQKGLTEAIKCLLEAGANPNVPDTVRFASFGECSICYSFYFKIFYTSSICLFAQHFGRLPIELAAEYGTWEDVELLFPVTSKIPTVADWSVNGVISNVHMEVTQLEDDEIVNKKKSELKRQGADAFSKEDYLNASVFYTQALKVDQFDATLFSNRSLCWLRLGDGKKALLDAIECKHLRPNWGKAYYRQGAALMSLEDYSSAYDAFSHGLELDPESEEMEKML
ncbi:hypothetical protein ACJX0J_008141, partial [Zea mays]